MIMPEGGLREAVAMTELTVLGFQRQNDRFFVQSKALEHLDGKSRGNSKQ